MSTGRPDPDSRSASASTAARSAKSTRCPVKERPSDSTASCTALPADSSRADTPITSAPAAASAVAIANPIPRRAPVTTASRPVRSNMPSPRRSVIGPSVIGPGPGAVHEHLHHALAVRQAREGGLGGGQRFDPRDQLGRGDRLIGDQLHRPFEVRTLVHPGAEQGQLAPEHPEQIDLALRRGDAPPDPPAAGTEREQSGRPPPPGNRPPPGDPRAGTPPPAGPPGR